jgi:anti-sigma factor RsiW
MADHVTDRLAAWLGGETSAGESVAITAHLETCAACRREADALRAAWDVLGAAEAPAAETSVWPAVRARTTAGSAGGAGLAVRLAWRGALATAAVAAGVLLGGLVPGGGVAVADDGEAFAWVEAGSWSEDNSGSVAELWLAVGEEEEGTP